MGLTYPIHAQCRRAGDQYGCTPGAHSTETPLPINTHPTETSGGQSQWDLHKADHLSPLQ